MFGVAPNALPVASRTLYLTELMESSQAFTPHRSKMKMATKNRREFSPHKLFWGEVGFEPTVAMYSQPAFAIFKELFTSGADKIYRDTVSTVAGWM
jgi:hypothetical protein